MPGKLVVVLSAALCAQSVQAATVPPRSQPRNAWGAVAYSSTTGAYGYAVDHPSKRSAESEAFKQCGADCDVIRSFRNACGVVAEAQKRYVWETGASRDIAEMKARKKCGADACRTVVWACTRGK